MWSSKFFYFIIFISLINSDLFGQKSKSQVLFDSIVQWEEEPEPFEVVSVLERLEEISNSEKELGINLLTLLTLTGYYYDLGEVEEFKKAATKAFQNSTIYNDTELRIDAINNFALYHSMIGSNNIALNNYLSALEISNRNSRNREVILFNIATIYYKIGDFSLAEEYCLEALDVIQNKAFNNSIEKRILFIRKVKALSSLLKYYTSQGNFEKGKRLVFRILDLIEKNSNYSKDDFDYQKVLFELENRLNIFYLTFQIEDKSSNSYKSYLGLSQYQNSFRSFQFFRLNGLWKKSTSDFVKSYSELMKSLEIAKNEYETDKEFAFIPKIHQNIGELYLDWNKPDSALMEFHEGLKFFDEALSDDLESNPTFKKYTEYPEALALLKYKARTSDSLYQNTNDQKYLRISEKAYMALVDLLDQMKKSYLIDGSKFFVAEKAYPLYSEALDLFYRSYALSNNHAKLNAIFQILEKNKSTILFENVKNKFELLSSKLPEDIKNQESELTSSVSFYSRLLSEEKQKDSLDLNRISEYERAVFEAQEELAILQNKIETEYPDFFDYRKELTKGYDLTVVQQKLNGNEALFEYFQTEDNIYALYIDRKKIELNRVQHLQKWNTQLLDHLDWISQKPTGNLEKFALARRNAFHLYQELLGCFSLDGIEKLIVVPDGILNRLPFETLVADTSAYNSYLLSKTNVSYYLSARQFLEEETVSKSEDHEVFCIAPEFSGPIEQSRSCALASLGKLPFAKDELLFLKETFHGVFDGDTSSIRSAFTDNYADFPIVHLATHACLNPEDPMLSEIHFTDGYLTNYDLQGLSSRPELVVLSACNTATGELKSGEGMMSLSRGFFASGVKSLQSSLWALDDKSSYDISTNMYLNLKKGMSKSEALQKSKMAFLESADKQHQHPYYWASMIHIGNDQAIFPSQSNMLLYIGASMLCVAGGLLMRRRRDRLDQAA